MACLCLKLYLKEPSSFQIWGASGLQSFAHQFAYCHLLEGKLTTQWLIFWKKLFLTKILLLWLIWKIVNFCLKKLYLVMLPSVLVKLSKMSKKKESLINAALLEAALLQCCVDLAGLLLSLITKQHNCSNWRTWIPTKIIFLLTKDEGLMYFIFNGSAAFSYGIAAWSLFERCCHLMALYSKLVSKSSGAVWLLTSGEIRQLIKNIIF